MILADTSIWTDHLHRGNPKLSMALDQGIVLIHPLVIGELACGFIRNRTTILELLDRLPVVPESTHPEVRTLIERQQLAGTGLGFVDIHLLASTILAGDVRLWTNDRSLDEVAQRLGVAED